MKPRERLLTAMRRQTPDRVPRELTMTPALLERFREKTGASDPAEHWGFEERIVAFRPPSAKADYSRYFGGSTPENATVDEWGVARRTGSLYHFTRMTHPLAAADTPEAIADYPLPDFCRPECWMHLSDQIADLHSRDLAAHGLLGQTIFETAWAIRGMEELLTDMAMRPELAEPLLNRMTDLRIAQAETMARADVDILRLGDDVGTQRGMLMSPRLFRRWLKPRLAAVIAAARTAKPEILIWYHSDGDCRPIIPDLIEIGVEILNPVQPECVDPAQIKAQYGDRLAFSGTIGTQTTMPFGTPAEVKAEVKKRIETVGRGGGLLLAPTHVLEPDVPWENILAFIEAVEEYGVYA
jgi:uroporphyrinogen decarboxylase